MNILFVGDIFGKPGRRVFRDHIDRLRARLEADLVVVNGENAAGGFGITQEMGDEMLGKAEVITSGNHIWDKKETQPYIGRQRRLLRPQNYPPTTPGRGWYVAETPGGHRVGVLNLMGRVFMDPVDCPFQTADRVLADKPEGLDTILVDMHAETTSEKWAMGWHLAGKVSAVVGTHTHVPTADERILSGHTGFISDVGMTGTFDSVIGIKKENVLKRMIHKLPERFEAANGPAELNAVLIQVDEAGGACTGIRRVRVSEEE
jgi:hypothetical protein